MGGMKLILNGDYAVTIDGDVISIKSNKTLRSYDNGHGYKTVCLCIDGKPKHYYVHRLVASAFVENPNDYPEVNHIDEDRGNNRAENLEWCTGSENMLHAYHNGLHSGATPVILVELGIQFPTIEEAVRFVNGKHSGIRRCLTGRNKTHRGFHFVRAEEDDHA